MKIIRDVNIDHLIPIVNTLTLPQCKKWIKKRGLNEIPQLIHAIGAENMLVFINSIGFEKSLELMELLGFEKW